MSHTLQEGLSSCLPNWAMKNGRRLLGAFFMALTISTVSLPFAAAEPPLANGGSVQGTILPGGQVDSFTFLAQAGQSVQIRMAETSDSGNFLPHIDLYDVATNQLVVFNDAPAGTVAALSVTLPAGLYRVEVFDGDSNQNSTADYNLYFALMPGANDGGALTDNTPIQGMIELGELDSYTFSANAGEFVSIQVDETSTPGNFSPRFDLYGPTGTKIGSAVDTLTASLAFNTTETGTYTVVVADGNSNLDSTADYEIEFLCNSCGTPPLPPTPLLNSPVNGSELTSSPVTFYRWADECGFGVLAVCWHH